MRTIGKRYPRNRPHGDYPAVDDYTGAVYYRSDMERDGAGLLRKKRARRERDRVTLAELEAMHASEIHHEPPPNDGNAAPIGTDDSGPAVSLESILAHSGQFWGPSS